MLSPFIRISRSIYRYMLSRAVPAILLYFTNQSCCSGFHLPFAAFADSINLFSAYPIRTGTRSLSPKFPRRRLPCCFLDNKFDRFISRSACLIIPIAHTHQRVAMFRKQFLRPFLPRPAPSDYECGSESAGCFSFSRVIKWSPRAI